MKEKVHFMKGILDYSFSKIVTKKQKFKSDKIKINNVSSKLQNINKLRLFELKELLSYLSELKYLDLNNFIEDDNINISAEKNIPINKKDNEKSNLININVDILIDNEKNKDSKCKKLFFYFD